ncbi:DMT family transporter [Elioraea sp.]|uniref:DMT family transporter n=1 Tax=Elioraea sp. TaxID=2185103 RepID=UPI003F70CF3B
MQPVSQSSGTGVERKTSSRSRCTTRRFVRISPPFMAEFPSLDARAARGVGLMVVSTFGFAGSHSLIRFVSAEIHPFETAFFRSLIGFLLMSPWIMRGGFAALKTTRFPAHLFRAVLNAGFMLSYFLGLSLAPLAKVTALSFLGPVVATAMAVVLLRERLDPIRLLGLALGVAGAVAIVRPGAVPFALGTGLVLLATLFWAAVMTTIKSLAKTETSLTIAAWMALLLIPISLGFALPVWVWPSRQAMMFLVAIGALATLGQLALGQAFRSADASLLYPVDFLRLVWASGFGVLVLSEIPDLWVWIGGAAISAAAGILAFGGRPRR